MQRTGLITSFVAALLLSLAISGRADSTCCSDGKGTSLQCKNALTRFGLGDYCGKVDPANVNAGYCLSCLTALATAPALSAMDMDTMAQQCLASNCDPDVIKCMCTFKQVTLGNQPFTAPNVAKYMSMCGGCSSISDANLKKQCTCCMQYTYAPAIANTAVVMAACTALSSLGVDFCNFQLNVPAFAPLIC